MAKYVPIVLVLIAIFAVVLLTRERQAVRLFGQTGGGYYCCDSANQACNGPYTSGCPPGQSYAGDLATCQSNCGGGGNSSSAASGGASSAGRVCCNDANATCPGSCAFCPTGADCFIPRGAETVTYSDGIAYCIAANGVDGAVCTGGASSAQSASSAADTSDSADSSQADTSDSSSSSSAEPQCGDGVKETGEECDAGANNGQIVGFECRDVVCYDDCTKPKCGDGVVNPCATVSGTSAETCDDGNTSNSDACTNKCAPPQCGDGIISPNFNETCEAQKDCPANTFCGNEDCRCTSEQVCSDTDAEPPYPDGINPVVKGTTTVQYGTTGGSDSDSYDDFCIGRTAVREYYCEDGVLLSKQINCESKYCAAGVCKAGPECGDGDIDSNANEQCEQTSDCGGSAECINCQCIDPVNHCGNGRTEYSLDEECETDQECFIFAPAVGDQEQQSFQYRCVSCNCEEGGSSASAGSPGSSTSSAVSQSPRSSTSSAVSQSPGSSTSSAVSQSPRSSTSSAVSQSQGSSTSSVGSSVSGSAVSTPSVASTSSIIGGGSSVVSGPVIEDSSSSAIVAAASSVPSTISSSPRTVSSAFFSMEIAQPVEERPTLILGAAETVRRAAPESVCGNGVVEAGEECDDGNRAAGDGCHGYCAREETLCGNGIPEYTEQCDDGNTRNGDGCDASCAKEESPLAGIPRETLVAAERLAEQMGYLITDDRQLAEFIEQWHLRDNPTLLAGQASFYGAAPYAPGMMPPSPLLPLLPYRQPSATPATGPAAVAVIGAGAAAGWSWMRRKRR